MGEETAAGSSGSAAPAVRTLEQWREIALSQAVELKRRAERVRVLIRERDTERWNAEAARTLAGNWARKADVDVDPNGVRKLADEWEKNLALLDEQRHRLDGQRMQVLGVAMQLEDLAAGRRVTDLDACELARLVAKELVAIATAQTPRKARQVFPDA